MITSWLLDFSNAGCESLSLQDFSGVLEKTFLLNIQNPNKI